MSTLIFFPLRVCFIIHGQVSWLHGRVSFLLEICWLESLSSWLLFVYTGDCFTDSILPWHSSPWKANTIWVWIFYVTFSFCIEHYANLSCSYFFNLGWFQTFFIFTPILGEMIQFDEHIFQMGGSTTNQFNLGWLEKNTLKNKLYGLGLVSPGLNPVELGGTHTLVFTYNVVISTPKK